MKEVSPFLSRDKTTASGRVTLEGSAGPARFLRSRSERIAGARASSTGFGKTNGRERNRGASPGCHPKQRDRRRPSWAGCQRQPDRTSRDQNSPPDARGPEGAFRYVLCPALRGFLKPRALPVVVYFCFSRLPECDACNHAHQVYRFLDHADRWEDSRWICHPSEYFFGSKACR